MKIRFIDTPWALCETINMTRVMRRGTELACRGEADESVLLYIEWESEGDAVAFEMEMESGLAVLKWRDGIWQTFEGKSGITMMILAIGLGVTICGHKSDWERAKDRLRQTYETLLGPFEIGETYTLECEFVDPLPAIEIESITIPK